MKVLVVLGHPNPGASFNRAIAETVVETVRRLGHEPKLLDLYAMKFDPILPFGEEKIAMEELPAEIQTMIADVRDSAGIVFVHPNWWGGPPAILRGWLDRVFRAGFAYRFSPDGVLPQFSEKTALVFSTSNTPRDVELAVYHDPLENFWKTIVFGLCGSRTFERRNFEQIILSDEETRKKWLTEVVETVRRYFSTADEK